MKISRCVFSARKNKTQLQSRKNYESQQVIFDHYPKKEKEVEEIRVTISKSNLCG